MRDEENLSVDHIAGKKIKDAEKYDNLIVLCHNCHHRKTNNKGISAEDIKKIKRVLVQSYLTVCGFNALKLCARNEEGVVALPFLVYHLVEMGFLEEMEQQMGYGDLAVTRRYIITEEGKRIFKKFK